MSTIYRMPVATGGPPPGAPLPRPDSVPAEVEVVEDQYVFGALSKEQEPPQRVSSRALSQRVAGEFVESLYDGPGLKPPFYRTMGEIVQLWGLRTGATPDLEVVSLPLNADTLLLPACEAIERSEPLLKKQVPNVFKDEDLDQVEQARDQVATADHIIKILEPLLHGATAMRTQGMRYLDAFCRRVYRRSEDEIGVHFLLNRDLEPLRQLVKIDAQTAQETKKLKAEVAATTEAVTLDRVKQALSAQPPAATPPAGGVTPGPLAGTGAPPPLPEPLHQAPARRGQASKRPK